MSKDTTEQLQQMLGLEDLKGVSLHRQIIEEVNKLNLIERWVDNEMSSVCEDNDVMKVALKEAKEEFISKFLGQESEPEEGVQYMLTGTADDKCIANGNTWKESEIKKESE